MRYIFRFPDIGEGLDEGTIAEWYVEKGQEVEMGESLVKMETDKVVTDIPSPKTGLIVKIYGKVGHQSESAARVGGFLGAGVYRKQRRVNRQRGTRKA